ncbi:MAG: hypothetical protein ABR608_08955 [Pseudonocardiaceae bacterium]
MAMTLRLDDDDTEALRAQAQAEGRSMQLVVQSAVREYVTRHTLRQEVDCALHVLTPRFSRLLDRLSDA